MPWLLEGDVNHLDRTCRISCFERILCSDFPVMRLSNEQFRPTVLFWPEEVSAAGQSRKPSSVGAPSRCLRPSCLLSWSSEAGLPCLRLSFVELCLYEV